MRLSVIKVVPRYVSLTGLLGQFPGSANEVDLGRLRIEGADRRHSKKPTIGLEKPFRHHPFGLKGEKLLGERVQAIELVLLEFRGSGFGAHPRNQPGNDQSRKDEGDQGQKIMWIAYVEPEKGRAEEEIEARRGKDRNDSSGPQISGHRLCNDQEHVQRNGGGQVHAQFESDERQQGQRKCADFRAYNACLPSAR